MEEIPEIPREKLLLFNGFTDLTFQEIKVWKSFLGSMVEANKVYFDKLSESAALIKKIGGEQREIKRKLGQNSIYAAEKIQEAIDKIGTFHKNVLGDVSKYKNPEGEFEDLYRHTEYRFEVLKKNAALHLREHEKIEKESEKAWNYYMRRMRKEADLQKKIEAKERHDGKLHYKRLKFAGKTSAAMSAYQACYQREVKHRKHLEKQSECLRREFLREEKNKLNTMFRFINTTLGKLEQITPQGLPGIDDIDYEMAPVKTRQMAKCSWDTYLKEKTFPSQMDEDPNQTMVQRFRYSDDEANDDSDDDEEEDIFIEKSVIETPIESFETPIQSFATTEECLTPAASPTASSQGFHTPVKSFKPPPKCQETPVECLDTQIECLETTSVECLESPVQHLQMPAKRSETPARSFKTPMQDFKRPTRSFQPKSKFNIGAGRNSGSLALNKRTSSIMEDDLDTVLQDILDDETLFEDPPRKSKSLPKPASSPETVLHAMTGSESNRSLRRKQELPSSVIEVGPVVDGHRSLRGQFQIPRNKQHKVRFTEDAAKDDEDIPDGKQSVKAPESPKRKYKVTTIVPSEEMEDDIPNEGNNVQETIKGSTTVLDTSSGQPNTEQGMQTHEATNNSKYLKDTSTEMLESRGEHADNILPDKESAEVQMRHTSNARRRRREAKAEVEEPREKRIPLPPPFPQQSYSSSATTGFSPRASEKGKQQGLGPKTGKIYVYPVCDWRRQSPDQLNLRRGAKVTQINSENGDGFCYGYKKSKFGSKKFGFFPAALVSLTPQI